MKITQVLYLVLFTGIIIWIATSTHLLDRVNEGFQNLSPEPVIAKGIASVKLPTEAMPNPSVPGSIPFAPYGQTPSVGSFPYQDPSLSPAELKQIKKLNEDLRSFLVFEGANISNNSDPTVQLPLTQLRADSQKLQQEMSTLEKNPGIKSTMTQQDLADIDGALSFLQRKVRLFQTAGVVSGGSVEEGFRGSVNEDSGPKTRATKDDLLDLKTKIYAAILILSSSGTTDVVLQARIKRLQKMYTDISDMIVKLDKGLMKDEDIPLYKEDIKAVLPNLAKPTNDLEDIFSKGSGTKLSPIEEQLSGLVGEENASAVFKNLMDKGMFKVSMDLGYNVPGEEDRYGAKKKNIYSRHIILQRDGTMASENTTSLAANASPFNGSENTPMQIDSPFDSVSSGMDDHAPVKPNVPSGLDWKKRAKSICDQVRLRGLNPLDFGCIPDGSLTSPAYSWRGHAKMVCSRLNATTDPDLPAVCGCPPSGWKGWTLSY
jgi:hypothetical protein